MRRGGGTQASSSYLNRSLRAERNTRDGPAAGTVLRVQNQPMVEAERQCTSGRVEKACGPRANGKRNLGECSDRRGDAKLQAFSLDDKPRIRLSKSAALTKTKAGLSTPARAAVLSATAQEWSGQKGARRDRQRRTSSSDHLL